jgi:hypothetical protein
VGAIRKIAAILATTAMVFTLSGISPASALTTGGQHTSSSREVLTVGTYYDLDYSCVESEPTVVYQVSNAGWNGMPDVPPGMTADPVTLHVSGTPTSAGLYGLANIICHLSGGGFDANAGVAVGDIQVVGTPDPTPLAPKVIATPLYDSGCSFRVDVIYPENSLPDSGSPRLKISNGDSYFILNGLIQGHFVSSTFRSFDFPDSVFDSEVWEIPDGVNTNINLCGHTLTFEVTYTHAGVTSEMGSSGEVFLSNNNVDKIFAWKVPSATGCMLHLDYFFGHQPDFVPGSDGSVTITYTEVGFSFNLVVHEVVVGDSGNVWFDLDENTDVDGSGWNHVANISGKSAGCGAGATVTWFYFDNGFPNSDMSFWDPFLPCGKGTFSVSGFETIDYGHCQDAPKGTFIASTGAKAPTACPGGMTTASTGSASAFDCYKPRVQTHKKLTAIKNLKFGQKVVLPRTTDQGFTETVKASGVCKVVSSSLKKKPIMRILALKKKGLCTLSIAAPGAGRILALKTKVRIKVSQNGK